MKDIRASAKERGEVLKAFDRAIIKGLTTQEEVEERYEKYVNQTGSSPEIAGAIICKELSQLKQNRKHAPLFWVVGLDLQAIAKSESEKLAVYRLVSLFA